MIFHNFPQLNGGWVGNGVLIMVVVVAVKVLVLRIVGRGSGVGAKGKSVGGVRWVVFWR